MLMFTGFVTPWNNHGYDVAKIFGAKFNYISPGIQLNKTKIGLMFLYSIYY